MTVLVIASYNSSGVLLFSNVRLLISDTSYKGSWSSHSATQSQGKCNQEISSLLFS